MTFDFTHILAAVRALEILTINERFTMRTLIQSIQLVIHLPSLRGGVIISDHPPVAELVRQ